MHCIHHQIWLSSPSSAWLSIYLCIAYKCFPIMLLPRPRRGLRGIVFTRSVCLCVCVSVCLCVCVCVRPIFWYFISQLLEEISIRNLYRIPISLWARYTHRYQSKGQITILFFIKYNMSIFKKSVIYRQIWQLSVKIFMVCICTLVYIYK